MSQVTTIEWTDVSWNPVHGCSKVSTGCKHCYAETLSLRYGQTTAPWSMRNAEQNVTLKPHKLREPLSKAGPWKNPCRVFVNSMSDLFHEQIPDEYIAQVFGVMARAKRHTFQVLTKRPERMRDLLADDAFHGAVADRILMADQPWGLADWEDHGTLPNVWLGVSIENRKWVSRADVLRQTPAAVRFISAEPLLGPLFYDRGCTPNCGCGNWDGELRWDDGHAGPQLDLTGIDWLIVGGESGPGHRPFEADWARDLRAECGATGTAFFVKQLGGARPGTKLEDLPEDLRIREYPDQARR
jgi:protein gp37